MKDLKKESGIKIKNSDKKEFIKTIIEPSKKEIMNTLSDALSNIKSNSEEYYGKDYKVKYKVKSKEKMSKAEIEDLCSYYKKEYPMLCYAFDSKDINKAITVSIDYTCKGSKNEKNKEVDINLFYISGDGWLMDDRSLDSLFSKK